MQVGKRAEGFNRSHRCIPRHNGASKHMANLREKAEKSRVRRAGQKACKVPIGE